MRKGLLVSLGGLLATAGLSQAWPDSVLPPAQPPTTEARRPEGPPAASPDPLARSVVPRLSPAPASPALPAAPVASPACPPTCSPDCSPPGPHFWASTEYLLWWVKSAPNPVPLVTANADPTTIGALTDPGTRVLFGGHGLDYGALSGVRTTVGGWLDQDGRFGLEASGFLLERAASGFRASSDGSTVLAIPFNAIVPFGSPVPLNPAGETALSTIGTPSTVTASSTLRLWGAEANALANLARSDRYRLDALVGFRYLDLQESLGLRDDFTDTATPGGVASFADSFSTRNQFYGGQLGGRFSTTFNRFTLDATGKVALGWTHESVNVLGLTTVTNGAFGLPSGTFPGGVFGEPSNSGRFTSDRFAVIPEAQLRLGCRFTRRLSGFVGYNFLYVSDVVRPGDQINRNVNPNQNAAAVLTGSSTGAPLVPLGPPPPFNHSDFWAHGVSFGLQLRF